MDLFEVELEDWLLENLNESFVVPEDFNMYRKLTRPTAKGLSFTSIFGFMRAKGKEVEKDHAELYALLNVRSYEHVSKIKETMGLSLDEFVSISYPKSWDTKPMSSKTRTCRVGGKRRQRSEGRGIGSKIGAACPNGPN